MLVYKAFVSSAHIHSCRDSSNPPIPNATTHLLTPLLTPSLTPAYADLTPLDVGQIVFTDFSRHLSTPEGEWVRFFGEIRCKCCEDIHGTGNMWCLRRKYPSATGSAPHLQPFENVDGFEIAIDMVAREGRSKNSSAKKPKGGSKGKEKGKKNENKNSEMLKKKQNETQTTEKRREKKRMTMRSSLIWSWRWLLRNLKIRMKMSKRTKAMIRLQLLLLLHMMMTMTTTMKKAKLEIKKEKLRHKNCRPA